MPGNFTEPTIWNNRAGHTGPVSLEAEQDTDSREAISFRFPCENTEDAVCVWEHTVFSYGHSYETSCGHQSAREDMAFCPWCGRRVFKKYSQ